ncbi:MAG: hypothetical protein WCJ41_13530 [Aestuariivirga sp.]
MSLTFFGLIIEITSSHIYLKGFGLECLWDRTGQVGSSFNRC